MAELPIHFVSVCHMFGVFIIAFGVQSNKTSLISILIPLGMGIMIPVNKRNIYNSMISFSFFWKYIFFFRWGHMFIDVFTLKSGKNLLTHQNY